MEMKVILDWKSFAALGAATIGIIFAVKMDPSAAKEVSMNIIDAAKECNMASSKAC